CRCLISDGAFLWAGRSTTHYITKFNKSDLSVIANIDLTGAAVNRLGQDDGFVYALQSESTPEPEVTKIDKTDLSITDWREEVNPDDPLIYSMFVDGGSLSLDTFSAPRDLTAVVNAVTGVVHFHWSPPLRHPELVTGYTLYESDGVTVAMPTALVYDFELTLAPGTYTYRLNATDGVTVSAFVSVTFTVDAPPITGADLFVIDDLTLENVFDDL